jgi:hypothetical protein
MKNPEGAEIVSGANDEGAESRGLGVSRRDRSSMRIPQIPMEWMDPMSWRLPSGKALAEFALQAGFLAPLMLSGPTKRKAKPVAKPAVEKSIEEAPETSGTFRETR